jgi:PKD repeat protein
MITINKVNCKMKKNLLLACFIVSSISISAQKKPFDASNAREGESVEYCHQHIKLIESLKDSAFAVQFAKDEAEYQKATKDPIEKGIVYKIPVVFHVLHNNGIENISHEQILTGLANLNRDFRLQNLDALTVHAEFLGMPSDIEVEFVLATKAPNGLCFNGVTRTFSPYSYIGDNGADQVDAIINGNNVYQGQWPGNNYLNVFVCGDIGGAAGYTSYPSGNSATNMTNGIWLLHNYLGSIGTSSVSHARVLTHEVGHWLNLPHTWGSTNNPALATNCNTDDGIADTPNCIGVQACVLNSNTCNSDNAYWGFDIRDNVENYMDYSYCSKMFTEGQKTRMRTALQSNNTGRSNLWSAANLLATGAGGLLTLCNTDFTADQTTICQGQSVEFLDASFNLVTSRVWSFIGGNPSSSSIANPIVTYSQPGLYPVTLTATDGNTNDIETKTNYIRVLPSATSLPFWEGFESYTSLANLPNWEIYNPNNNNEFELENNTAYTGIKCAKLGNFGQNPSNVDELISAPIDLSIIPDSGIVTLSFRYAYRKRTVDDFEYLKVFITNNCGNTWAQRKTISGNLLSPYASGSSWSPTSNDDWVTVHMPNVTNNYFTPDFRMRFRFEGEGGNNFYLDDINLYAGGPSDEIVQIATVSDMEGLVNGVSIFPNPAEDAITVQFNAQLNTAIHYKMLDITGKFLQGNAIMAIEGENLLVLDTQKLSAGTYLIQLISEGRSVTLPFIIR